MDRAFKIKIKEDSNEIRVLFNPNCYDIRDLDIRPLLISVSPRVKVAGLNQKRIRSGEIVVRFKRWQPKTDVKLISKVIYEYFAKLPSTC